MEIAIQGILETVDKLLDWHPSSITLGVLCIGSFVGAIVADYLLHKYLKEENEDE